MLVLPVGEHDILEETAKMQTAKEFLTHTKKRRLLIALFSAILIAGSLWVSGSTSAEELSWFRDLNSAEIIGSNTLSSQIVNRIGFATMNVGEVKPISFTLTGGTYGSYYNFYLTAWRYQNGQSVASTAVAFSTNSYGPFSSSLNLTFQVDSFNSWQSPTIYVKAISASSQTYIDVRGDALAGVLGDADAISIDSPPPAPTPTPAISLTATYGSETYLAVGASKHFAVTLTHFPAYSIGTLKLTEPTQDFVFRGEEPGDFVNTLLIPVQFDSTGTTEVKLWVRGAKASGAPKMIEARFYPAQGSSLAKTVSMTAVNVQSIWFERDSGQIPIDNNPHVGGGLRVFPEKKTPTDTSFGRNKVTVKAKTFPVAAGLKIDFKIFDVDDPEWVSPSDPDGAVYVDLTGSSGNDNRGASSLMTIGLQGFTNTDGIAQKTVLVSPQPGDNIRVAAIVQGGTYSNHNLDNYCCSTVRTYPVDITLPNGTIIRSEIGLKDGDNNVVTEIGGNTSVAVATKMLTTWRRLHLEVDSMGPVTGNFLSGTITNTTSVPFGTGSNVTIDRTMENNRFQNGRMEVTTGGTTTAYKIASSSRNSLLVSANLTDALIGSTVKLFDDDDMNANDPARLDGDNGEDVPAPDLGWLQDVDHFTDNSLAIAYIRPTYDLGGNETNLPFYSNGPKADLAAEESTNAELEIMTNFDNEATRDDPEFWTGYILGAYQPYYQGDGDPAGDHAINQVSGYSGITAEFGAIVFLEKLSEETGHKYLQFDDPGYNGFNDWRDTPLHEVLHLLNADDGDGGQIDAQYYGLSGKTQNKVRNTRLPFMCYVCDTQ